MLITIDFNSDEAIYLQIYNQIVLGIATARLTEGQSLPSVRRLAEETGVNMHTVNKAYALLRQEGYLTMDRRNGAVIAIETDRTDILETMKQQMRIVLAQGRCKNVTCEDVHHMVDEIFEEYR